MKFFSGVATFESVLQNSFTKSSFKIIIDQQIWLQHYNNVQHLISAVSYQIVILAAFSNRS